MPSTEPDGLWGTLDLLVLKTLSAGPMHGWGISEHVRQISEGKLELKPGSLHPALKRLEKSGLVRSEWGRTPNNRHARYYELTRSGRIAFRDELERWEQFIKAVQVVLRKTP